MEVIGLFRKIFRHSNKTRTSQYYRERIQYYIQKGDFNKAIRECEVYFNCSKNDQETLKAAVQEYYGYCFLRLGKFSRAIQELARVHTMKPTDHIMYLAYSNIGNAYKNMGQGQKALQNFKESLRYATNKDDHHIVEIFIREIQRYNEVK
ncbi:hypothetical protein JW979_05935 [bacterium]|nr:hypothetical protein [candidate division CSSED10-310 bacterium]